MIFNFKHIDAVTDEELLSIVTTSLPERQHIEFKANFIGQTDDQKLEFLKDIASLANSGGGYYFIGIKEDGRGQAKEFEGLSQVDADRIKNSALDLCTKHIHDLIANLEVIVRPIQHDHKTSHIVIIRIPNTPNKPHMVTFHERTDFFHRIHDGKKAMTFSQIRSAFNDDLNSRQLSSISTNINDLMDQLSAIKISSTNSMATTSNIIGSDNRIILEKSVEEYEAQIEGLPALWLGLIPAAPLASYIDINQSDIKQLLLRPPTYRDFGFDMNIPSHQVFYGGGFIGRGNPQTTQLIIHESGLIEFKAIITESFCWRQTDDEFAKRPTLSPYAVIEIPAAFLKFCRATLEHLGIDQTVIVGLRYMNIKGFCLGADFSGWPIFSVDLGGTPITPYKRDSIAPNFLTLQPGFLADEAAFQLVKSSYNSFGFDQDIIPFYDRDKREFIFQR